MSSLPLADVVPVAVEPSDAVESADSAPVVAVSVDGVESFDSLVSSAAYPINEPTTFDDVPAYGIA